MIGSIEVVMSNSNNYLNYTQPQFTLYGRTNGGLPTTSTWRRDGAVLASSSTYTISNPELVNNGTGLCADYTYQSSLTVSGRLPGVYAYVASYRLSPVLIMSTLTIESM